MFGLSLKEQLSNALINCYKNNIEKYKDSIRYVIANCELEAENK